VPPALDGTVEILDVNVDAAIEAVCPEKVIVCGKVTKVIRYTAVGLDGTQTVKTITDERSFQCFIDRDDADEGEPTDFTIVGADLLCEASAFVQNMGTRPGPGGIGTVNVFWKLIEKDVVKVCIRKSEQNG
jgi:hypothetical protein